MAGRNASEALLPGKALVLSPHQDDETIGCGLLMAEKANRGTPVAVAVATDGRAGWYSPTPRPSPQDIVEVRHIEWHRALDALGVPRTERFELKFPDGTLSEHEDELTDRLGDLFRSVIPSQVFVTRSGDPHPDHRTLARAVGRALHRIYDPDTGVVQAETAAGSNPRATSIRPELFTYRVYPGEGVWPDGRPASVTASATVARFARSLLGLTHRRALLLRAPGSAATKAAAIHSYDSQSALLGGELRYVWDARVELYWPMDAEGG